MGLPSATAADGGLIMAIGTTLKRKTRPLPRFGVGEGGGGNVIHYIYPEFTVHRYRYRYCVLQARVTRLHHLKNPDVCD